MNKRLFLLIALMAGSVKTYASNSFLANFTELLSDGAITVDEVDIGEIVTAQEITKENPVQPLVQQEKMNDRDDEITMPLLYGNQISPLALFSLFSGVVVTGLMIRHMVTY